MMRHHERLWGSHCTVFMAKQGHMTVPKYSLIFPLSDSQNAVDSNDTNYGRLWKLRYMFCMLNSVYSKGV